MGAVNAIVLLKGLLRGAVESECGCGGFETRGGDAPGTVGATPSGEVVAFDPDQAFDHTSPALCVRLGLKLGGDGWNTSMHRARKVDSCQSPKTIFHGIASGKSD